MNKLTIPAILAGIVMIAGAFAFMPVQDASTVHTAVQNTMIRDAQLTTVTDWQTTATDSDNDDLTLTCTGDAIVHEIMFEADTNTGDNVANNISLIIDVDGDNTVFNAVTQTDIFGTSAPEDEPNLLTTKGIDNGISLVDGGTIKLRLAGENTNNDKAPEVAAIYTSQSTCSWKQE